MLTTPPQHPPAQSAEPDRRVPVIPACQELGMLETRAELIDRIGQALHRAYEELVHEPTPERWIKLINRLNEEEVVQRVKSMGDDSSR